MKKTVGVLSLLVMLLSQVFSPFVYAVSGVETIIEEPVILEAEKQETVEEPTVVEEETTEEAEDSEETENPIGDGIIAVDTIEDTENNPWNTIELPEKESEVTSGDTESMSGDTNNLSGTSENLSGEQKNLKEETDNLTGAENSSGFLENIKQGIKNLLGIGDNEKSETNEDFESMEIYGTGEYEGIKVEVYAATGLFASGTVLIIEPIVEEELEQVKEVLISGDVQMIEEDDEQTLVAFDITFRDPETQEELQPKTGTVQLKFNYEDNISLVQAEENEEQEVKVYHLNDIDEDGNKIEELIGTTVEEVAVNEEERENNKVVIDVNKFSPYVILLSTLNTDVYTVSFNTNGGTPKNDVEITGGTKLIMSSGLQHSYTRNISEDGTYTENYGNSWGDSDVVNKIITIPGVDKLKVTIKHGTESTRYDWICMRAGLYPNYTAEKNYSTSMVGKLGGTTNTLTSNTYYVDGDTVTFSFRSDTSSNYYGYYATVEGLIDNYGDDPIREGSKFLGRFTEEGNERNIYDDKVESDITLNAKWECKYGYYTGENNQSCIELPYSQYTIEGDDSTRNTFKYRTLKIAGSNGSEYFVMDKNLGAFEAWDGTRNDSSHNVSYGYYYQRGNNYGFSSKTTSAGGYSQITVSDDKIPSKYSSSSWINNEKWNVQDDLRGAGGTEEDRKGPCPEGWHIPEILERKEIYKAREKSENRTTDKGTIAQNFMYDLKIPPAGYRNYNMNFGNLGSVSNLWSTTTYIDLYARNFFVRSANLIWNNAENRSDGIPVRCVMNNPEYSVTLHIDDKIIQQRYKKNSLITIPLNSTDDNHVIEGWYIDENFTTKFDFSQVVSGNIELYANQIEFKYDTITIYNPDNPYSGFIIMDRNLGAIESGTGEGAYGYLYQRGNNYGFSNTGELALFETQAEWNDSYDNSGYYETGFYADNDYWLDDVNHVGLWGGSGDNRTNNRGLDSINETVENRKGPCPEGWHVPSAGEWSKLLEYWKKGNIIDGSMYSDNNLNYIYFRNNNDKQKLISDLNLVNPGYRTNEGTIQGLGNSNYQYEYRSSTPVGGSYSSSDTKYSYVFYMDGNYIEVNNYIGARNHGRPLRCFKNVYNPDFYTIKFKTNGGYDFEDVLVPKGGKFSTLNEPQKLGYFFEGWFIDESLSIPYDYSQPVNNNLTLYAKRKGDFGTISISDPDNPYSGFTIMDRNLGAKEAGTGENSYGYMYQWGNNHGFPYRGYYSYMNTKITTGFSIWDDSYDKKGYYGTQYVVWNNDVNDYWNDNQLHDGLWGGDDDVVENNRGFDIIKDTAVYRKGPCPEGRHIPSAGEWSKLLEYRDKTNTYQTHSESHVEISNYELNKLSLVGNNLSQYFLFPMRGYYYNSNGTSYNTFYYTEGNPTGYFRSSSPVKSEKYVFSLYLTKKDVYAGYVYNRSNGHTIRCFKNQFDLLPEYDLIYDTNGGNQIDDKKIRANHKLTGLPTPTRENSIFEGWYLNDTFTEEYDFNQLISGNLKFFAKWGCVSGYVLSEDLQSCEKISVKFRANGGAFLDGNTYIVQSITNNIKSDDIKYSHTPNVDDAGNKVSNYEKFLNINDVVSMPGAVRLNIKIIYGTYSTDYDWLTMWSGNYPEYTAMNNYNSSIFGKLGGGYYTNLENTKEYIIEGDTVTFGFHSSQYDYGGGRYGYYAVITEGDNFVTTYSGDAFDNIQIPSRDGYDFDGWYFDNGTFEHEFNKSDVITGYSMNAYAKWKPHHYTIKFDINGGTGNIQDINATYGEKIILPKVTKEGYYLSGWQSEDGVLYRNYIPEGTGLTTEDGGVVLLTAQRQVNPPAAGGGKTITPAAKEQEHNSAEEQKQEEKKTIDQTEKKIEVEQVPAKTNNSSTQSTTRTTTNTTVDPLILSAYEWAYEHNITTISSLDDANPDGPVTRGHLAKMVVNYATNVLGREIPEKIPSECRWNDWRKDRESEEIKDYAVKSCALGLMGLDMPKFLPNMQVTRAQFGTIMSRLLWGKRYAGGTPYYRKHLNALKENNIMTQIDNPEKRVELRQWVWLMLMRSAQNK